MFTGFTEETIRFFLDLRFHNNSAYFHENHDRYIEQVQQPFYAFINDMAPLLQEIDPRMEVRPHKCLSRINRDIRFSRDKSPYRDHLWIAFRRAAESKDGSVNFFFEFGPDVLGWGMGTWGENKPMNERLRRQMVADPRRVAAIMDRCHLQDSDLVMMGNWYKRMDVPLMIPPSLRPLYTMRDLYITRKHTERGNAFSRQILDEVSKDYQLMAPLYRLFRGIQDELQEEELQRQQEIRQAEQSRLPKDEW